MPPQLSQTAPRPNQASPKDRIRPAITRITPAIPLTFFRDPKPKAPPADTEPPPAAPAEAGAVSGQSSTATTDGNEGPLTPESGPSHASGPASDIHAPSEGVADVAGSDSAPAEAGAVPGPPASSEPTQEADPSSMHPARPHLRGGNDVNLSRGRPRQLFYRGSPLKSSHEPSPTYSHDRQPTPTSASSITHPAAMGPQQPPFLHHPRPSANGLVFGGYADSSSPSPAQTGFPNGAGYPIPQGARPPMPPFVPHHAHTSSNPANVPLTFPPPGMPLPGFAYGEPPTHAGRPPTWFNPEANFFPQNMLPPEFVSEQRLLNGEALSRQMSQASSGARDLSSPLSQDDTVAPRFDGHALQSRQGSNDGRHQTNGVGIHAHQQHPQRPTAYPTNHRQYHTFGPHMHGFLLASHPQKPDFFENSVLLLQYWLYTQFGKQDFADHVLELSHGSQIIFAMPIHGVVVARSPTLMAAISGQATHQGHGKSLPKLRLEVKDKFFADYAFTNALEYLYGAPLPNFHAITQGLPPVYDDGATGFAQGALEHALGLISAGLFLQLETVAMHGFNFAKRVLRWDTIEKALAFSLDGGLTPPWLVRELGSRRSSIDLSSNKPTYGEFSGNLLVDIVDFIAINFPVDFRFVALSPQLEDSPRLPITTDSRSSISGARLSRIQFGEIPVERPGFIDSILSSVLISVPFIVLKAVFEHSALLNRLSAEQIVDTLRQVVEERETRRLKVLRSKRVAPSSDPSLWEATKWEERIEEHPLSRIGLTLARERRSVNEDNEGKD